MNNLICIKHKDISYCWNTETSQIEKVTTEPIHISDCPEIVVYELMKLLDNMAHNKGVVK